MATIDEAEIRRRAECLAGLQPRPEATRQAIERTRAVLQSDAGKKRKHFVRAILMKSSIAAAILICAGMLLVAVTGDGATVAFADVRSHIEQAKSIVYTETLNLGGEHKFVQRIFVKKPGAIRTERIGEHMNTIEISDSRKGLHLMLFPRLKLARLRKTKPLAGKYDVRFVGVGTDSGKMFKPEGPQAPLPDAPQNFLAELKKLVQQAETPLGVKTIDGKKVKGFRLGTKPNVLEMWVDAETGHPVRIEKPMPMPYGQGALVMTDFAFDEPFDDALFSTDPPEDYKLYRDPSMWPTISEKDLLDALGALAKLNKGTFPPQLHITAERNKALSKQLLSKQLPATKPSIEQRIEQLWKIRDELTLAWLFLQRLPDGSEWQYAGTPVKLGDAATPVLWYRKPSSKTCRVVYGDLSVKDIQPAKLPKFPDESTIHKIQPPSEKTRTIVARGLFITTTVSPGPKPQTATKPATKRVGTAPDSE